MYYDKYDIIIHKLAKMLYKMSKNQSIASIGSSNKLLDGDGEQIIRKVCKRFDYFGKIFNHF